MCVVILRQEKDPPDATDKTMSFDYVMLLYYILIRKLFDLGTIIQGAILT